MYHVSKDFGYFVTHLRLEAFALAALMVALTHVSSAPLWILPATFIAFDIGMVGYVVSSRIGALTYNIAHNATVPTLFITFGVVFDWELLSIVGFCWTFHIAVDRILGYGLKHKHSFIHTHLGEIGKKK